MRKAVALGALALSLAFAAAGGAAPRGNGLIAYAFTPERAPTEIRLVSPDGGQARRLTAGTTPAWSPDGIELVFADGPLLVVMRPDGSARRVLTEGATPAWSPDGSRIAFTRPAPQTYKHDLFTIGVDGNGLVQLTRGDWDDRHPGWSPDGSRIVFEREGAIWTVARDGTGERVLLPGNGRQRTPRFSPDGMRLAFERAGVVYTVAADGSGPERRVSPRGLYTIGPAWSPDGTRIAFDAGGAVCTARVDGTDARRVTFDAKWQTTFSVGPPPLDWQPAAGPSAADSPYSCDEPRWDVVATITANRQRARVGDIATYRATTRNAGPDPATLTTFYVRLPDSASLVAVSGAHCSAERSSGILNTVRCDPPIMFPGDAATVTISARLLVPGPARATVEMPIWADPRDVNGENDRASVSILVGGCTIAGTHAADVIRGTAGPDVICGLDGNDTIRALGGDDVVWAGEGDDVVEAGAGDDRVLAGAGRDHVDGGDGNDVVWGGFGKDVVWGAAGSDSLHGGETGGRTNESAPYRDEADLLQGGPGADVLAGGLGVDSLRAGDGNDVVRVRDGQRDSADCGAGRDRIERDRYDRQRGCERSATA